MFHIPNTNAYIRLNQNDVRPEAIKNKDVLLAHKEVDLKTGDVIVIFSRTTPEKIAQFKSLKPLMLAARNELDALNRQAYFKKHGTAIPGELLRNIKHLLSISTEKMFSATDKQIKKSLQQISDNSGKNTTPNSHISSTNNFYDNHLNNVKIPKKALSAEAFENLFKNTS